MTNPLFEAPLPIKRFKAHIADLRDVSLGGPDRAKWDVAATEELYRLGWEKLGDGDYASVYGHPSKPYVIKVFMKDTPYLKWLHYCAQHTSNPYLPKIRGKIVRLSEVVFAVRLERLEHFDHSHLEILYNMEAICRDPIDSLQDHELQKDPRLTEVLRFLAANMNILDIHSGNILSRSNGFPVIVDPFYNRKFNGSYVMDRNNIDAYKELF